jgi:hypothetical protein
MVNDSTAVVFDGERAADAAGLSPSATLAGRLRLMTVPGPALGSSGGVR